MAKRFSKAKQKKAAKEHMESLFLRAIAVMKDDKSLAQRYVTLARKVAMKFRLQAPSEYKRLYCKHCYKIMIPGETSRVRVHESRVIYHCLNCKKFWRKPLKGKEKKG